MSPYKENSNIDKIKKFQGILDSAPLDTNKLSTDFLKTGQEFLSFSIREKNGLGANFFSSIIGM